MKKTILSISLLCLSSIAFAQTPLGYLVDSKGDLVKTGTGLCIRTGSWTPENSLPECEGQVTNMETSPHVNSIPVPNETINQVPVTMTHNLSSDILFGFDKYNITNEGKKVLMNIIANHDSTNDFKTTTTLNIVGFTDPIGTEQYNLTLSKKRAEAVKQFFISQGFMSENIAAVGKGKHELRVTKEDCKGQHLISCLAPDRRVEITLNIK